jgi:hypothetical protein
MHPITEKKQELKQLANHIRTLKDRRKDHNAGQWETSYEGQRYRHGHIAYCLVRGRTYEQIEQPRENNKIDEYTWIKIDQLYGALKQKVDEANEAWAKDHPKLEVANG